MGMADWSRRHALQAVATAGALALAGCSSETSRSRSLPPDREPVTDYEATLVRNTDGEPVFVDPEDESGDESSDDEEGTGEETGDVPRAYSTVMHLTGDEELDRLQFRDVQGASELTSFLRATDLESESVYLLQRAIGECYEPRLVGVAREDNGVDADFCRELRPADVDCDADAHDVIAIAIRLPFPGEEFSGLGTGWGSSCDHEHAVRITEGGDAA